VGGALAGPVVAMLSDSWFGGRKIQTQQLVLIFSAGSLAMFYITSRLGMCVSKKSISCWEGMSVPFACYGTRAQSPAAVFAFLLARQWKMRYCSCLCLCLFA
jgi:hypothetical protein